MKTDRSKLTISQSPSKGLSPSKEQPHFSFLSKIESLTEGNGKILPSNEKIIEAFRDYLNHHLNDRLDPSYFEEVEKLKFILKK